MITLASVRVRLADKARWLTVGAFSEAEYQEQLSRNISLQAYRAHANDQMTKRSIPPKHCGCQKDSYGCKLCNPGGYAGEGYYSNDPSVTSDVRTHYWR